MTGDPAPTVVILPAERAVQVNGETRQIGARAFDVLAYLHAHTGRVVTKAELLEHVWADLNVEESNLTVQIAALRKLIGARAIATVPGVGYWSDQRSCRSRSTARRASLRRACAIRISSGARRMALRWAFRAVAWARAPQAVRNRAIIGAKAAAIFAVLLTDCEWLMGKSVMVCSSGSG